MLDLEVLKRKLDQAKGSNGRGELIGVTPAALRQIIAELEAGREAAARTGGCFGLGEGRTL